MAQRAAQKTNARQEKLAALRAEQARKRRRVLATVGAIAVVVVVVVALVVVKLATNQSGSTKPSAASAGASSAVVGKVTGVPAGVYDKVGKGDIQAPPSAIPGNHPLTAAGKPRVLYVGAEYCPYCAAERWAVVAALARFGTFSNLGQTTSSSADVYPSTATLSFHGAGYTSKYLAFTGYELETNQQQGGSYAPLDTPSAADKKLLDTYDAAPYVPAQSAGAIPFIDLGGRYMISGASYSPATLANMSHTQIADALANPASPVAQSIDGTANVITAALCQMTHGQPASVCTSPGVTAAAKALPGA